VTVNHAQALSTDELLASYCQAGRAHGQATLDGDLDVANENADRIAAIYRELRRRGAESVLLTLLNSRDEGVLAWAAAHALEFAPERGEPALVSLSERPGLIGFEAEITLGEWRSGRLRFP
jgi:hypothetical protein